MNILKYIAMSSNKSFITVEQHNKQVKIEEMKKRKEEREAAKIVKEQQQAEKIRIKQEKEALRLRELELKPKRKVRKNNNIDNEIIDEPTNEPIIQPIIKPKTEDIKVQMMDDELSITNKLSKMINVDNVSINYKPKFNILKDSQNVISKIIHIADIHIRLSTLHDEYNQVFEKLYIELRNIKEQESNCIICLCGDLLHSKDELKPNTIIQTWNFIKNLSDIFPLIIITGNHDTIELNNNKIDSITAILKDRPITNTYYLLNSGVYIYNNIVFGVSSIIDKFMMSRNIVNDVLASNNYISSYENSHIKYIGLYHGSVDGCIINEYGTRLRGSKKISHFACPISGLTYDYILLGDIHKFQYLDKNKTVAYSSSLISQNFTETDDYHGFLEWNILDGLSQYHKIKNDYAYHKININELFDIKNINESPSIILDDVSIHNCLKNINSGFVRIDFDEVIAPKINRELLKNQINALYPLITITWLLYYKKEIILDADISNDISNNSITVQTDIQQEVENDTETDLTLENRLNCLTNNTDYINNLIRRYMKMNFYGIADDMIEKILEYLNKIILETQSLENEIEYINSDWKILWLSFDNMYGYGPNNVIDFTKYPNNEIVGIFGDNAIGKSSIIDIITYMLFSRSARDDASANPKDIVNVNTNKAQGILIIESNNIKYLIKRNCTRRSYKGSDTRFNIISNLFTYKMIEKTEENKNKLQDIFRLHDKEYILESLTEENRLCTDNVLVPIIGTYDNFITTSVLLQGMHKSFKSKTNVQKKDFLCQILKITYFNKCENIINDRYKALKVQFNTVKNIYNSFNNTKSITDLKYELSNIENQIISCDEKSTLFELDINSKYDMVQSLTSNIIHIDNFQDINILDLTNSQDEITLQINNDRDKIIALKNDIMNFKSSIINVDMQEEIIDKFEKHNNELKIKQDDIMNKINSCFDEKQKLKLYVVPETDQNKLNTKLDETNKSNAVLNNIHNNISNIYNKINELIKNMYEIGPNVKINNEEELKNTQDERKQLVSHLANYSKEQAAVSNKSQSISRDIEKLNLIKFRDIIVKEYNDFIEYKKNKQAKITNDIDTIMSLQPISLTYIDSNIKLDVLLTKQIQILSLLNENHENIQNVYKQCENILSIDENDKLYFNTSYINKLNKDNELLQNKLCSLTANLYSNDCIDTLQINKSLMEKYFNDEKTIHCLANKDNIISIYHKMKNDSSVLIYESLDDINNNVVKCINSKTYIPTSFETIKNNVNIIKQSLNVVLDKNIDDNNFIKEYNEIVLFEKEHANNNNIYTNIIADIKTHKKINNIKTQLDNNKNTYQTIDRVKLLIKYFEKINNELTVELDDILNNILIINSNNEKQEQINKNNKKINDLRCEYDNITVISTTFNASIETIYNNYNSQQYIFMNLNDVLTSNNSKLQELNVLINSTNEKILEIDNDIDVYNNIKGNLSHNNNIQDKIEDLYDEIDTIKNSYKIDINDITDVKILLDTIFDDIMKNNSIIKEINTNLETIILNDKIMGVIDGINENINELKMELDNINQPNNEIVVNFKNLQNNLLSNSKFNDLITNNMNEINEIENNIDKYTKKFETISDKIRSYNDLKIHIVHNNEINLQISSLKEDIKNINIDIKNTLNLKSVLHIKRDNLLKLITDLERTNNELDIIKIEMNIYELLTKLTSRDGVQLFLLAESLQTITNKVNNILEPFINKTINMIMNGDMIELSILSKNGNIIHTISGMESFMLDLVFKIIIAQISVIPKSNIMFMDESISVLDASRMASIEELFVFLKQYYSTVFLITHMKQVNNHISHSLNIIKHNDNSLIFNIDINNDSIKEVLVVKENKDKNKDKDKDPIKRRKPRVITN